LGARTQFWSCVVWLARRTVAKGFRLVGLSSQAMTLAPCGQIIHVPDDDQLWRRFTNSDNHLMWSDNLGRRIPNPAVLRFDPDLSTDWRQHLEAIHCQSPRVLLKGNPGYALVGEFPVGGVRLLRFVVRGTPNTLSSLGCAHASIEWPPDAIPPQRTEPTKDVRRKLRHELAQEVSWVYGDISMVPPEGA